MKKAAIIILAIIALVAFFTKKSEANEASDKQLTSEASEQTPSELASDISSSPSSQSERLLLAKRQQATSPDDEFIITHNQYMVSYNITHNNPNYVAWQLTKDEIVGTADRHLSSFTPDPLAPQGHEIITQDYTHSGYDRGHMCPAADNKCSQLWMDESHYMTNIAPQDPTLNRDWWERLETACRRWAANEGEIYICCGPIYDDSNKAIGSKHRITIPYAFFKVVLCLVKGREKAIGFIYENSDIKQPMASVAMSVDAVEEITGYDFFYQLNDSLEDILESKYNLNEWK